MFFREEKLVNGKLFVRIGPNPSGAWREVTYEELLSLLYEVRSALQSLTLRPPIYPHPDTVPSPKTQPFPWKYPTSPTWPDGGWWPPQTWM